MAIPDCSTCVNNRRPVMSENGLHYVCALSGQAARKCIIGEKDRYDENPRLAWKRINDGFSELCNEKGNEDGK